MKIYLGLIGLMFAVISGSSLRADDVTQKAPFVSVKTSGFSVRIAPPWSWTPDTIAYRGQLLAEPSGLYGLVFDIGDGKFIGSGHREGGSEQVLGVQLEADGKPVEFLKGGTIAGEDVVFSKQSRVGDLSLRSVLRISADEIDAEHFVHVDKDFKVSRMYAFMYPWLPSTSQWMGETLDAKPVEGKFENKGFIVNEKLRWCAVYEPKSKTAAITWFAPDHGEQDFLLFFNDHEAYHKQYFRTMSQREVKAGEEFHYVMKLRAVVAEEGEWKQKARQVAAAIMTQHMTSKTRQ